MSMDIDSFIEGGSPAFKFEDVGDVHEITVTGAALRQQTDVDTGAPKTWSNGDPMMQLVIDGVTDDGTDGRFYAKGGNFEVASGEGKSLLEAIKDALATAGIKGSQMVGARLKVAHTGLGKRTKAAYTAPKLYKAKVTPKAAANLEDF